MKILKKINSVLKDNSGETIVEVLIAFVLLTIMMLIFAEGLSFATNSQANAKETRNSADNSMKSLQKQLSSTNPTADGNGFSVTKKNSISNTAGTNTYTVTPYRYEDETGNVYIVFMPET